MRARNGAIAGSSHTPKQIEHRRGDVELRRGHVLQRAQLCRLPVASACPGGASIHIGTRISSS